jgi:hypothetical protein
MTCPHCGFENLEENTECFRCGQALDLTDVEVVPDRLRRGPSSRWAERGHRRVPQWKAPVAAIPRLDATGCALFSVVPGLGHMLYGQRLRGLMLALLWLSAIGVAWYADPPLLLTRDVVVDWLQHPRWLPITTHAWIIADAWQMRLRQCGVRVSTGELCLVTMVAVVLLAAPNTQLEMHQLHDAALGLRPMLVREDLDDAAIQDGDTVLFREVGGHSDGLQAGDVVLTMTQMFRNRPVGAQRVGTVHAVAGDVVVWAQAGYRLTVNAVPHNVPKHVVAALFSTPDERFVMGAGELLLFPGPRETMTSWKDAIVPESRLQAVALRITDPPARRRILRMR